MKEIDTKSYFLPPPSCKQETGGRDPTCATQLVRENLGLHGDDKPVRPRLRFGGVSLVLPGRVPYSGSFRAVGCKPRPPGHGSSTISGLHIHLEEVCPGSLPGVGIPGGVFKPRISAAIAASGQSANGTGDLQDPPCGRSHLHRGSNEHFM